MTADQDKKLPKILFLFMAVDWQIYMRRPAVFALAEAAKEFGMTIVAINRPLCPLTTILKKRNRLGELFGKAKLESLADNLYLYSPKYFLHDHIADRIPGFLGINKIALRSSLQSLMNRINVYEEKPIVMFNYPQQGYVAELYKESFSIYELYDELCSVDGEPDVMMIEKEKKLRGKIDLLLTTSHALDEKYGVNYQNRIMYGNGLSRESYNRLSKQSSGTAEILKEIPSPRIGYVGMLSERIDWDLVTELAKVSPEWQYVFVGPLANQKIYGFVKDVLNVHILEPVAQNDVPNVLQSLDVGIMPYRDTDFFYYLNALKFYEMAAAGLPMVSSPVEEMRRYPESIISVIQNDIDIWKSAIEQKLRADRKEVLKVGQEIAGQFIWEDMAKRLLYKISELM